MPQVNEAAVGMPASAITCLAKDFEPSILAAAAPGPKQPKPASRSASPAPATSGASGPITTRSGLSLRASARIPAGARRGIRIRFRQGLDAGVARGGVDVVRSEGADQGVLAPPGTDDEYAHARSLPAPAD